MCILICGRINEVFCFCHSPSTKLLIDHMGLSREKWQCKYTSILSSDEQRHPKQGYKLLWITQSCLRNNCSAHEKAFTSLGQKPYLNHIWKLPEHIITPFHRIINRIQTVFMLLVFQVGFTDFASCFNVTSCQTYFFECHVLFH